LGGGGGNYSAAELLLAYEERLVAWQHSMFLSDFIQTSFESILSVVHYTGHVDFSKHETRGEQIPRAWRKNFVLWRLIFMGLQYGTCFMSLLWSPEFFGGSYIFAKLVHSCTGR
jgi:cyanate permease